MLGPLKEKSMLMTIPISIVGFRHGFTTMIWVVVVTQQPTQTPH
jgi:hypothetical protein